MKNGKKLLLLLLVLAVLVGATAIVGTIGKMPPIRRTKRRQCFLSTRKT